MGVQEEISGMMNNATHIHRLTLTFQGRRQGVRHSYDGERAFAISDHSHIVKFKNDLDPGFSAVIGVIEDMKKRGPVKETRVYLLLSAVIIEFSLVVKQERID